MVITHASISNNWNNINYFPNAETLILGSFNPNNPNVLNGNTDYFYGRSSNFFWKAIAELNNIDINSFTDNIELKFEYMQLNRFCFLDIINSIEISTDADNNLLNEFVQNKIFKDFTDQVLFTSKTKFKGSSILIARNYNFEIPNLVLNSRINKIIHTLGNSRIDQNFTTKPKEQNVGENGFQILINQINNIDNVNFISQSFSPSKYAVNRSEENYYSELKNWLRNNLYFN